MSDTGGRLLDVQNLTLQLDGVKGKPVLVNQLSFGLKAGETLGLVGESGSGKTLSALALLGLLPNGILRTGGSIKFAGKTVSEKGNVDFRQLRGRSISMIFQHPKAALNPTFTIATQFKDIIKAARKMPAAAIAKHMMTLLDRVGFEDTQRILSLYPHQLSGGMAQRVMIAMALSSQPQLIIGDEPTSSLDVVTEIAICELIEELQREYQFALLLISHDLRLIARLAKEALVIRGGNFIEQGPTAQLLQSPAHPYTKQLAKSVFRLQNNYE